MKKIIFLLLILVSCTQVKKEDRNELIAKITDSISKNIELKYRAKIDSLKSEIEVNESEEDEFLSKLAYVNFYKWKRDFISKFKERNENGFEDKILENDSGILTIGHKRKVKLNGIYKGKDVVLNDFFETVRLCPEVLSLFRGDYELDLEKKERYHLIFALLENVINNNDYGCDCYSFDKADIIKNDTIYSLDIFKGDCRGVFFKKKIEQENNSK